MRKRNLKIMSQFSDSLKLNYILFQRFVRKLLFFIPIKDNRVIFESFSGEGYNCNPKYISEALSRKYGDKLEIFWALKNETSIDDNVKTCKYRGFKHLIYRITAKVYVCNFLQAIEIPKRKGQIEIQTWHGGGCYKKIGNEEKARNNAYVKRRDMHVAETDYFIASSKYFEQEVVRKQLGYKGKVLEIGMPRNDCLVNEIKESRIKEIREKAGLSLNSFVVLYAPTWREDVHEFELLDYERISQSFAKRFKKDCQFAFRAHVYGNEKGVGVKDLSNYPDMQELLLACDCLITDYSSSMWDFSLTGKPCFLYVPDLKQYIEQRGFDKDIDSWGFPVCESNDELKATIENFDIVNFQKKMKEHQNNLCSYEHGSASQEVADLIARICGVA